MRLPSCFGVLLSNLSFGSHRLSPHFAFVAIYEIIVVVDATIRVHCLCKQNTESAKGGDAA